VLTPALEAAALAALAAVALLLLAPLAGGRSQVSALAVGMGFALGSNRLFGNPGWPPAEAHLWLRPIALAATCWGTLDAARRPPGWARWGARVVISAASLGVILRPMALYSWATGESIAWLVGLEVALLGSWGNLDALADRLPGPALPLTLAVVAGSGSVALLLSGSVDLAGLGMALTAPLVVLSLAGLIAPRSASRGGYASVFAPIALGLGLNGLFYADLPRGSALLLLIAPAAGWLGRVGPARKLGPRGLALACAAAALIPAALAVALALAASPPLTVGVRTPAAGPVMLR